MSSKYKQGKTKTYDFTHRELIEMPLIEEEDYCDIFLDYNSLTNIDSIPSSCLKLSASNNKISTINSSTHVQMLMQPNPNLHLQFLDLSSNRLINLGGIDNLIAVSSLNLSNNYISDDQLCYLALLKNLKQLNLSNNNLKNGTIAKIISDLNSIERINLNNNNIESLAFSESNDTLIQLDIDSNKLISLSFNKNSFNSLTYLSINNNKLNSIPTIANLLQLTYISIESNSIQNISLHMLMKLKCIKLNNNSIQKYSALNSSAEIIELSYNNLSEFYLSNTNNHLKSLLLNNNKLDQIAIDDNNNLNLTIEFIDLANNSLKQVGFIRFFPKLIRVNLAFNLLSDLNEVLSILKELQFLRELNLIENIFNKGVYNLELFTLTFNSIGDYCNNTIAKNTNCKLSLEEYRSYVISNLNQITFLDIIAITQQERDNAYKRKDKDRDNHKDKEQHNNNIPNKKLSNHLSKRYLIPPQENNRPIKNKEQLSQNQTNETDYNNKANNAQQKVKNEIMSKLVDMFVNFQDNYGYIYYKQVVYIFNELNHLYNITQHTSNILTDIKNTIKASLIPYKIHIKELIKILDQKQYDSMFIQIKSNIKQSKTIETKKVAHSTNNSNKNTPLITLTKEEIATPSLHRPKGSIKAKSKINSKQNSEKKMLSRTSTTPLIQSPFLSSYRSTRQETKENKLTKMNSLIKQNGCFNILFQSNSELNDPPDLSNKEFLINFLYFINHINILLSYKNIGSSYIIPITKEEKEYKFLKTFLSNYNISQAFKLKKWYNYNYYSQVFLNWNSIDYLFENNPIFFFSYYNEIIDNFINKKKSSHHDCYLMIEENPSNLLSKRERNKIVMHVNIQKNKNNVPLNDEEPITNLIFNEDDEQFYFKNPFEWINDNNTRVIINNSCILVPVYIISFD